MAVKKQPRRLPIQRAWGISVRCERCAADLAERAPALAFLQPEDSQHPPKWQTFKLDRAPSLNRLRNQLSGPLPEEWQQNIHPRALAENVTAGHRGIEFVCRRCSRRLRIRFRRLYELAERATKEGRPDIYV